MSKPVEPDTHLIPREVAFQSTHDSHALTGLPICSIAFVSRVELGGMRSASTALLNFSIIVSFI